MGVPLVIIHFRLGFSLFQPSIVRKVAMKIEELIINVKPIGSSVLESCFAGISRLVGPQISLEHLAISWGKRIHIGSIWLGVPQEVVSLQLIMENPSKMDFGVAPILGNLHICS